MLLPQGKIMSPSDGAQDRQQQKTISLVLGSGGARGLAHIGVIEELEAWGYSIRAVPGSSIRALVGGFYRHTEGCLHGARVLSGGTDNRTGPDAGA